MHKVPCKWISFKVPTIPVMSDAEEDLDGVQLSQHKIETDRPSLRLEHFEQNQQINGELQVESLRKFHHSLMG